MELQYRWIKKLVHTSSIGMKGCIMSSTINIHPSCSFRVSENYVIFYSAPINKAIQSPRHYSIENGLSSTNKCYKFENPLNNIVGFGKARNYIYRIAVSVHKKGIVTDDIADAEGNIKHIVSII